MKENSFTLPAYAKINLGLKILGKRADHFHELYTVFQTVSLADALTFEENEQLILTCDDEKIPTDKNNLIVRAAELLKEKYCVASGAKIHLEKKIPSPGGLGGGSSDAATTLVGLTKLWKLKIDFADLQKICAELGSDVPFFLYGGTCLGTGRGTEIEKLSEFEADFLLIITPLVNISTAAAFNALNAPNLTNRASKSILKICRQQAENAFLRQTSLENDFEEVIFKIEPEILRAKQKLLETGAIAAALSGSGASVYGIFENEETRQAAIKAIKNENWRKFAVATVSRASLPREFKVVSD